MEIFNEAVGLFQKGGLVMYPLLLCSIMVVAIALERYIYYRSVDGDLEKFIPELTVKMERNDFKGALILCQQSNAAFAKVVGEGIKCWAGDRHGVEHALEGGAGLAAGRMRLRLSYLETIVTMAPLLGLLGTVTGMIQTFSVMNIKAGQPHAITGGVGEALVATATGLCVAILALVVHTYFSHWQDKLVTDMEESCHKLLAAKTGGTSNETA